MLVKRLDRWILLGRKVRDDTPFIGIADLGGGCGLGNLEDRICVGCGLSFCLGDR